MSADQKYRVLVVDDEAAVLLTYRLILSGRAMTFWPAVPPRQPLHAMEQQRFDVVLCDYSLEEQHTGFEVISVARRH